MNSITPDISNFSSSELSDLWAWLVDDLAESWSALLTGSLASPAAKANTNLVYAHIERIREISFQALSHRYPGISISEEGVHDWPPDGDCLTVDLVDGTNSLLLGAPMFGLQFALIVDGQLQDAAIFLPTEQRLAGGGLYLARRGGGTHLICNGTVLHSLKVSSTASLSDSTLAVDGVTPTLGSLYRPTLINNVQRIRNFGAFCWAVTRLVRGQHMPVSIDAVIALNNRPWDHLPGILLVEEAGGFVSAYHRPWSISDCRSLVLSNGALHEALLGHLLGADEVKP